jgi:hypothetical protein
VAIGLKRLVFVDDYAIWRAILVQRSSYGENPGTASNPASTMNPIFADAGIPFRFRLSGNRLFNGHETEKWDALSGSTRSVGRT